MNRFINLPKWIDVEDSLLEEIDLGKKFDPIRRRDWETDKIFIRGPVTVTSSPLTNQDKKDFFPLIAFNVSIVDEQQRIIEMQTNIGTVSLSVGGMMNDDGTKIKFMSPYSGEIIIRLTTKADLKYTGQLFGDLHSVDDYLKNIFGA